MHGKLQKLIKKNTLYVQFFQNELKKAGSYMRRGADLVASSGRVVLFIHTTYIFFSSLAECTNSEMSNSCNKKM